MPGVRTDGKPKTAPWFVRDVSHMSKTLWRVVNSAAT
jgi:hypothetical protein